VEPGTRLDSWKEIATYLKRDPRTVRRWERAEGLPVHRHQHGKKASVYAFAHEIDTWLVGRRVTEGTGQLTVGHAPQPSAGPLSESLPKERRTRPVVLAILPLRNLSGDREQERFADGLTEEVISEAGQYCPNRLRVIAATSVLQYKQSPKGIGEIGRNLGADYILEGGIRQYGRRVRLTARLIAARDEANIWADTYEIQLPPVFTLQQSLARQVVDSLAAVLRVAPAQSPHRRILPDAAAYKAYLEGQSFMLPSEGEIMKRLEHLHMAIERDPKFARGYAELAFTYFSHFFRDYPPVVVSARIRELTSRCMELDPSLARAHTMLAAFCLFGTRNWPRAQASSGRAVKLNPSDPWGRIVRAAYYVVMEEPENAITELEQARQGGAQSAELSQWLVVLGFYARRYDWAIERGQEMLQLDPIPGLIHGILGGCYAQKGNNALALQHCEMAAELSTGPFAASARAASTYAVTGNRDAAERLVQELIAAEEKEYVRYMFLAQASVALGNEEQTLDWLEKSYEQRDPLLVFLKADARFDPLLAHPRFRRLLRRIGLPK
jgi:TolB-like protein/Flp pilus assembly protein TadD